RISSKRSVPKITRTSSTITFPWRRSRISRARSLGAVDVGSRAPKHGFETTLGGMLQVDFATIELRQIANDRQSQARSRDLFIQALADLKHHFHRFRGQAVAVVFHHDHDLLRALVHAAANGNFFRAPFAGV